MCAASVYPEPGSNSHIIGIYTCIFLCIYISFLFEFFDSISYAFAFFFFGSFTTALLVSQSLLFTFQCAFYVISILLFRTLYYCTIFKSICQHFFKSFFSFFHIVFTAKKVQNNKLVFDAFFRFLLTLY